MQAQLAQERFRANNAGYGSLADIGVRADLACRATTGSQVVASDAAGFELLASAVAGQARDIEVPPSAPRARRRARSTYASGSDATTANGADANRACWSR